MQPLEPLEWTWDQDKNRANLEKHGIDFETAQLIFYDPLSITAEDSYPYEQRLKTMGTVRQAILVVIHTLPSPGMGSNGEVGRIISARRATSRERRSYEEDQTGIN